MTVFDIDNTKWEPKPGWSVDQQSNSAFHQLRWPRIDLSDLHCTLRAQGQFNPGGTRTMCGSDLQAFIDSLMPPPMTMTTAVTPSADATLSAAQPNLNDGANLELELGADSAGRVGASFGRGRRHHARGSADELVIRFPEDRIARFLDGAELAAATLRLTLAEGSGHWGWYGRSVTLRPLRDAFVEGNGNAAANDRGTDTGTTWHCAEDAEISDDVEECLQHWARSSFASSGRRHRRPGAEAWFDWERGALHFDVTEDLRDGINGWIVSRNRWRRHGGSLAFHSREGAGELRDPTLAPTLLLRRDGIPEVAAVAN